MNKKILLVYYKLHKPGGVAKVMSTLANELVEEGYTVEILLMMETTEPHFYDLHPDIKIHRVNMFSHWAFKICTFNKKIFKGFSKINNINSYISHIGVYLLLKNWMAKHHKNYDSIISCWYKLSSFIALHKNIAKKTIAWEHTDYNVGGFLYKDILRKYYKNIKSIVCINSPSKKYYQQFSSTYFIPNIIGEPFESKAFINYDRKNDLITFIGRLDKDKNVRELIEIFSETKIPKHWKLQIIGEGWEMKNLEQLISQKQLSNQIELKGTKSSKEISYLLDQSKISVSTSLKEGLPTVLIESMFSSNALIAYNCNYGPSDIINENNGFLIPLHDKDLFKEKLEFLTQNPSELNQLITSSYEESQKWKKEKNLQQWKEIL